MDLPEILEEEIFGTLYADEDEDGRYYGNIDIYGESITIGFLVQPDEYEVTLTLTPLNFFCVI